MKPHEVKTRVFGTLSELAIEQVLDEVRLLAVTRDDQREEITIDIGDERFIIGLTVRQEKP